MSNTTKVYHLNVVFAGVYFLDRHKKCGRCYMVSCRSCGNSPFKGQVNIASQLKVGHHIIFSRSGSHISHKKQWWGNVKGIKGFAHQKIVLLYGREATNELQGTKKNFVSKTLVSLLATLNIHVEIASLHYHIKPISSTRVLEVHCVSVSLNITLESLASCSPKRQYSCLCVQIAAPTVLAVQLSLL